MDRTLRVCATSERNDALQSSRVSLRSTHHPMCGRTTLLFTWAELSALMRLTTDLNVPIPRRFNLAPTQTAPIVRATADGGREVAMLRWGLVPSWAKDLSVGSRMINARAETVATKPAFRSALRSRRCLIPISGFYEWQQLEDRKQPWYIHMKAEPLFMLAGLWERWVPPDGDPIETYTIITTTANELLARFHERMPVILPPVHHDRWLDPAENDVAFLQSLLVPYSTDEMEAYEVRTLVNRASVDEPACIEPFAQ